MILPSFVFWVALPSSSSLSQTDPSPAQRYHLYWPAPTLISALVQPRCHGIKGCQLDVSLFVQRACHSLEFRGCNIFRLCLFCGWVFSKISSEFLWQQLQTLVWLGIFWLFSATNIREKIKMFGANAFSRIPQIFSPQGIHAHIWCGFFW